ncbi:succinate semialdehyde dehydrogenase [Cantharellus anzutake]|uniref:succinate semialdehyde dehydrogenase n=1 Tax=Cantharellus anzutake TaxID=1750568 RepID=UPI0019057F60|nr:succinate semialdehyde dehydrogenase [Cantharellus anzutake]KAF8314821.1 succinate semialdehyde dehydrogenase [Cantharellus anzutake]
MPQTTITPHDQSRYVTRELTTDYDSVLNKASTAQRSWAKVPIEKRIEIANRFVEEFEKLSEQIIPELTLQMGRPVSQNAGEIRGTLDRSKFMISIASSSLSDVELKDSDKPGFRRFIRREPLGVVFVISPWNYPYLTMINSVLPALIAGNAVILKPSPQTPLTAERLASAFYTAGLPPETLQVVHLTPQGVEAVTKHPKVDFVSFTGSVQNGRVVSRAAAASDNFPGVALELGGKDPAYVMGNADFDYTVAELVDGAFFNSGQSCCAVERIYVHESLFDKFVRAYVELVKKYGLGNPTEKDTNLGPVVSLASAEKIRKQVSDAIGAGAKALIPEQLFPCAREGTTYVAPQVLIDVTHSMDVMKEETFGPVVGIMKVSSDEEAIKLMNDSPYGLTASIWTSSQDDFLELVDKVEAGTVYQNRCDYLDPALSWTGVKWSGRGISLSKFGYDQLTRVKSVHIKYKTS